MIGLDIAKSVFHVFWEDSAGRIVIQKRLRRGQVVAFFAKLPAARIGIEACGSAHYRGRRLTELGHEVRLIPAAYVKPFVRRNKTDARDAAAICVALGRPDMRFVAIKNVEQQAARAIERSRGLLVKQHTQLMNSVRSQLAEFGIIVAVGRRGFGQLTARVASGEADIPSLALDVLRLLIQQTDALTAAIATLEDRIMVLARDHAVMRRLTTIPGVGR
jgi:transposase